MCEKVVVVTHYTCGTSLQQDVSFTPCLRMAERDHKVKETFLDSSKARVPCEQYTCSKCGPGGVVVEDAANTASITTTAGGN